MSAGSWYHRYVLPFLDKTNITVTALTAVFQLYTRSAGVAYFIAGALGCSITVKLLKRVLRQPRPKHPSAKHTYGMPSTHAATIAYYCVYIALACAYLPAHTTLPRGALTAIIPPAIVIPWATLIAGSRVWLGHHTWPQVLVGCSYGGAWAVLWLKLWTSGLDGYGRLVEQTVDRYLP